MIRECVFDRYRKNKIDEFRLQKRDYELREVVDGSGKNRLKEFDELRSSEDEASPVSGTSRHV